MWRRWQANRFEMRTGRSALISSQFLPGAIVATRTVVRSLPAASGLSTGSASAALHCCAARREGERRRSASGPGPASSSPADAAPATQRQGGGA